MAARANSLTEHATDAVRHVDYAWSMPATDVRAFLEAFERLGYGAERLLASAGIPTADISDPDARIPCEHFGRIVSAAQEQRFTPNLAMELARVTPLGASSTAATLMVRVLGDGSRLTPPLTRLPSSLTWNVNAA